MLDRVLKADLFSVVTRVRQKIFPSYAKLLSPIFCRAPGVPDNLIRITPVIY